MREAIIIKTRIDGSNPMDDKHNPIIYCGGHLYNTFINNPDGVTIEAVGRPRLVVKVVASSDPNFFKTK